MFVILIFSFFFKQKPAYDVRISDWSSDVCSSDLNKVSDGRDKDRHLPGPLFGGPAVLRHRVHGPLALREHGNLSRRGIETDRDDADPGRFRGLDGEVPVSTALGRCRTALARPFGPTPSLRSRPKPTPMQRPDPSPHPAV